MKKKLIALSLVFIASISLWLVSITVTAQKAPPSAKPGSSLQQRLAQRKRERNIRLDKRDRQRLESRCNKVQSFLRGNQNNLSETATNRIKTYDRIDAKLWVVIGELKLSERDTIKLEKQRSALAKKVNAFQVTLRDYQQTIDDIIVVNCQADVVGFQALVETARLYLARLRVQIADIQTYVIDQVKTTLSNETTALQPQASGGDD